MASQNISILMSSLFLTLIMFFSSIVEGGLRSNVLSKFSDENGVKGTKWALLIAGSNEYMNYRHQADICHAYHVLKRGGLKDENIIVFMYDDIAYNQENPRPGVIINNPKGGNVYPHVPKDYTGENVTASNFYAAIIGEKKGIKGGSGKVLNTKPNDHIFIYYADHGGPGILGMPNDAMLYANDFVNVLKNKYASKSYKSMVIYVEACEAGSIFDGVLPKNVSIYVTTASKSDESSYACYCDEKVGLPEGYTNVCLGDMYSVAWIEDRDTCNLENETLDQQYIAVRNRTIVGEEGVSHVTQYGDISLRKELLGLYMGPNCNKKAQTSGSSSPTPLNAIEQRDADLFYFQQKVKSTEKGSNDRIEAEKQLNEEISRRKHVDQSIASIGQAMGMPLINNIIRPAGLALVDDWDCFKSMVETYEAHCGPLRNYGRKYLRAFANMCNAGSHSGQLALAAARVCVMPSYEEAEPISLNA